MECPHVSVGASDEKPLDRFAGSGDSPVDSQTREVTPWVAELAPLGLIRVEPSLWKVEVVAGSYGEAVDDVDQADVECFEELAKHLEDSQKHLTHRVQATVDRHNRGSVPLAVEVLGRIKGFPPVVIPAIKGDELIIHRIAPVRKEEVKKNSLGIIFASANGWWLSHAG